MKTLLFVVVVLGSGAAAGLVHGAVNLVLVEPYLDSATELENRALFAAGQASDTPEFRAGYEEYRSWQKSGMVMGTVVLGASVGALFGIVFALARDSLPGRGHLAKSVALAGIMWLVLFVVPFLKYPANPPGAGEADAVGARILLYVAFVAISGAGAACFYRLSRALPAGRKALAPAGYAALVIAAFVLLPDGPDAGGVPQDFVAEFRTVSLLGVTSFWASVGIIFGISWSRLDARGRACVDDSYHVE